MKRTLSLALCAAAATAMALSMPTTALAQDDQAQTQQHRPKLWLGDDAPAITVTDWVKGDSVQKFEEGKIYVVEFWATWCGPCVASMPHLSAVQKEYKDKGVTIIGVSTRDPNNTLEQVKEMVKQKGETMGYTVGFDADGSMSRGWMQPAEQRGIPAAFVIDKKGKIAYIGHPMWLDIPVGGLIDGSWDPKTGMDRINEAEGLLMQAYRAPSPEKKLEAFESFASKYPAVAHQSMFRPLHFSLLLENEKFDRAWSVGGDIVEDAMAAKDAQTLNQVAWTIVDPAADWKEQNLPLALKAAREAVADTDEKDASTLDTLARVYWDMGEKSRAIETQRKAVENAEDFMKAELEKTLKEYEDAEKIGG